MRIKEQKQMQHNPLPDITKLKPAAEDVVVDLVEVVHLVAEAEAAEAVKHIYIKRRINICGLLV
jgi:hypothetical protein